MAGLAILPPREAGGGAVRVTVAGGEVGFRAEPEGDAQSPITPGQNSSSGTHTSGRKWQQLGTVSGLEQANVGWVIGSCHLCGLPLAAHHVTSL